VLLLLCLFLLLLLLQLQLGGQLVSPHTQLVVKQGDVTWRVPG
jgi:hypothetical protein